MARHILKNILRAGVLLPVLFVVGCATTEPDPWAEPPAYAIRKPKCPVGFTFVCIEESSASKKCGCVDRDSMRALLDPNGR